MFGASVPYDDEEALELLKTQHESLIVNNWPDLPSGALNVGKFMRVRNVGYAGADVVAKADGEWYFRNGEIVLGMMTGVPKSFIVPAATFTGYTLSSAASGTRTLITAGGAHGVTGTFAVNKSIYVFGGPGWTTGFYDVKAVALDTTGTSLEIDLPYSAVRGAPVIALPNDFVPFFSIPVPPLLDNSYFSVVTGFNYTNSAVTKTPVVRLTDGSVNLDAMSVLGVTTHDGGSYLTTIRNFGSKTAQITGIAATHGGGLASTTAPATNGTVNTASASMLIIGGKLSAAMAFMRPNLAIVRLAR